MSSAVLVRRAPTLVTVREVNAAAIALGEGGGPHPVVAAIVGADSVFAGLAHGMSASCPLAAIVSSPAPTTPELTSATPHSISDARQSEPRSSFV